MQGVTVYSPSEEALGAIRAQLEKDYPAASYTSDARVAARAQTVVAVLLRPEEGVLEEVRGMAAEGCGTIVAVRKEHYAAARRYFAGSGAVVLRLPLNHELFSQAVDIVSDLVGRLRRVRTERDTLRTTLDDLKLVDRAKCALIQYLRMSEQEAHRFIERQAMNRRVPKREVAMEILKTYES